MEISHHQYISTKWHTAISLVIELNTSLTNTMEQSPS